MRSVRTRVRKARGPAGDASVDDHLHPTGTPELEIFADDLLEETPSGEGTIEHLGQGELDCRMDR